MKTLPLIGFLAVTGHCYSESPSAKPESAPPAASSSSSSSSAETAESDPAETAALDYASKLRKLLGSEVEVMETKDFTLRMTVDGKPLERRVTFMRTPAGWVPMASAEDLARKLTEPVETGIAGSPETGSGAAGPLTRKKEERGETERMRMPDVAAKAPARGGNSLVPKGRWVDRDGRKVYVVEGEASPAPAAEEAKAPVEAPAPPAPAAAPQKGASGGRWIEKDGKKVFVSEPEKNPVPAAGNPAPAKQNPAPDAPKSPEQLTKGRWVEKDGRKVFQTDP